VEGIQHSFALKMHLNFRKQNYGQLASTNERLAVLSQSSVVVSCINQKIKKKNQKKSREKNQKKKRERERQ
jgi:hypothetical protein